MKRIWFRDGSCSHYVLKHSQCRYSTLYRYCLETVIGCNTLAISSFDIFIFHSLVMKVSLGLRTCMLKKQKLKKKGVKYSMISCDFAFSCILLLLFSMNTKRVKKLGGLHMPHISLSLQPQSLSFLSILGLHLNFFQVKKETGLHTCIMYNSFSCHMHSTSLSLLLFCPFLMGKKNV